MLSVVDNLGSSHIYPFFYSHQTGNVGLQHNLIMPLNFILLRASNPTYILTYSDIQNGCNTLFPIA